MNNMYVHITGQRPDGRFQDLLIDQDAYDEALQEAQEEDDEAGPEIFFVPGSTEVKLVGIVELRYAREAHRPQGELVPGMYPESYGDGI